MSSEELHSTSLNGLVMTHWEPEFYSSASNDLIMQELLINALLYDEVLIKDSDLILNSDLTNILSQRENFTIFEQLLQTGLVKILTIPLKSDNPKIKSNPNVYPLTARSEEISGTKGLKEMAWSPSPSQERLYKNLDTVLGKTSSFRTTKPLRSENPFAEELGNYLANRKSYQLDRFPLFRGIDEKLADLMAKCCYEPGYWVQYLHDIGKPPEKTGEVGKFTRFPAYKILEAFPESAGTSKMKNLIQSVYNTCYCENEDVAGRWGGRLIEAPIKDPLNEDSEDLGELLKIEIIPTKHKLRLPIAPEVVEMILATKETIKSEGLFQDHQTKGIPPAIMDMTEPEIQSLNFKWEIISQIFSKKMSRAKARISKSERVVLEIVPFLFTAADHFCGWGIDKIYLIGRFGFAYPAKLLLKKIRTGSIYHELRKDLREAIEIRCSKVTR